MSITYPLSLPSTPGPKTQKFTPTNLVGLSTGEFDGIQQIQEWPGEWWQLEEQLPPMPVATARAWIAKLAALRGMAGTFLEGPHEPNGGTATSGYVSSSHAAGSKTLEVNINGSLNAGDYIEITDDANVKRLHMVLTSATGGYTSGTPVTAFGITSDGLQIITYALPIIAISQTGNIVTVTMAYQVPYAVGQTVYISGITPSGFNGTFTILAVDGVTFTYSNSTTGLTGWVLGQIGDAGEYYRPLTSLSQSSTTVTASYLDIALTDPYGLLSVIIDGCSVAAYNGMHLYNSSIGNPVAFDLVTTGLPTLGGTATCYGLEIALSTVPGQLPAVGQSVVVAGATNPAYNKAWTVTSLRKLATMGSRGGGGGAIYWFVNCRAVVGDLTTASGGGTMTTGLDYNTFLGINAISQSGSIVTVTLNAQVPARVAVGDLVTLAGITPNSFNGSYYITSIDGTQFTYSNPTTGLTGWSCGEISTYTSNVWRPITSLTQSGYICTAIYAGTTLVDPSYLNHISVRGCSVADYNGDWLLSSSISTHPIKFTTSPDGSSGLASVGGGLASFQWSDQAVYVGDSLDLFPRLRADLAGGEAINMVKPKGTFRLSQNAREWSVDEAHVYGLSITAREAI